MIDGVYDADEAKESKRLAKEAAAMEALGEKQLDQRVRKLEKEMLEAARNLEFERAAHLRDQIAALKASTPATVTKPVKYPAGKSARGKRVSS
jgi:excinuclease ABC subunit B